MKKPVKMTPPTPHNEAKAGDFAKTVLMPGDPRRAEFIAKTYLENPRLVNNVRGINGYTGTYKGERVSVMASGMGVPSIGIYSYELFNAYDVDNIIRVGSAGSIAPGVKLRDIVLGMSACTNTAYAAQYGLRGTFAPTASYALLKKAADNAEKMGLSYHVGSLLTSDTFYSADETEAQNWSAMGVMAIEMEAAALYMNAAYLGKNALAICTISDEVFTGRETTPEERQNTFTQMMELALEVSIS